MKKIRNMRELELMQDKLLLQEKLAEKELVGSSANILDNFTDKLKDLAFDLGTNLAMQLISSFKRTKNKKEETEDD